MSPTTTGGKREQFCIPPAPPGKNVRSTLGSARTRLGMHLRALALVAIAALVLGLPQASSAQPAQGTATATAVAIPLAQVASGSAPHSEEFIAAMSSPSQLMAVPPASGHQIRVEVRDEVGRIVPPSTLGHMSPNIRVGFGWYIYVYLNAADINWLHGLGYTVATAALCAILTTTIVASVACAAAAYIIYTIYYRPITLPPGYCAEFAFNYDGSVRSVKLVRTSC